MTRLDWKRTPVPEYKSYVSAAPRGGNYDRPFYGAYKFIPCIYDKNNRVLSKQLIPRHRGSYIVIQDQLEREFARLKRLGYEEIKPPVSDSDWSKKGGLYGGAWQRRMMNSVADYVFVKGEDAVKVKYASKDEAKRAVLKYYVASEDNTNIAYGDLVDRILTTIKGREFKTLRPLLIAKKVFDYHDHYILMLYFERYLNINIEMDRKFDKNYNLQTTLHRGSQMGQ